jgi:hypothetical protein
LALDDQSLAPPAPDQQQPDQPQQMAANTPQQQQPAQLDQASQDQLNAILGATHNTRPPEEPGAASNGPLDPASNQLDALDNQGTEEPHHATPEEEPYSIWGALKKGWGYGTGEFSQGIQAAKHHMSPQTEAAPKPQDESWLGEDLELNDFKDMWNRGLPKLAYHVGESAPETGVGIGAGAAGAAVGVPGGPVGALLGASAAVGATNALHKVGPYYAKELAENPTDEEGAWDRAWKRAAASGAINGASFAAFGAANPFKNLAGNLLFKAGSQPALAAAHQEIQSEISGRHATPGELGEAAGQGALGAALPAIAVGGTRLAGSVAGKIGNTIRGVHADLPTALDPPEITAANHLHDFAQSMYGAVKADRTPLNPSVLKDLQTTIQKKLYNEDIDPATESGPLIPINRLTRGTADPILDDEGNEIAPGPVYLSDLHQRLRNLGQLQRQSEATASMPNDKTNASRIAFLSNMGRQEISNFLKSEPRLIEAGIDPDKAAGLAAASSQGARAWAASRELDRFGYYTNRARINSQLTGKSYDESLRNEMGNLMKSPRAFEGFSNDGQDLIRQMASEVQSTGLYHRFGRLINPESTTGLWFALGAEHFVPGSLLLAGLGGEAAKALHQSKFTRVGKLGAQVPSKIASPIFKAAGQPVPEGIEPPGPAPYQPPGPLQVIGRPQIQSPEAKRPKSPEYSGYARGGRVSEAVNVARSIARNHAKNMH